MNRSHTEGDCRTLRTLVFTFVSFLAEVLMKVQKHRLLRGLGTLALAAVAATPLLPRTVHAAGRAQIQGPADAAQAVSFDIYLPLQHRDALETLLRQQQDKNSAHYHKWLKPADFQARFGADPKAMTAITEELRAEGLTVTHTVGQRLHVSGTAAAVEHALGTTLMKATYSSGKVAVIATSTRSGPASMKTASAMVLGLSGKGSLRSSARLSAAQPDNRESPNGGYWFDELKQAYNFPSYQVLTGKGAKIGILMAGGYQASDMDLYFSHEKMTTPNYSVVNVNGGSPYDPGNGGTLESNLDLQQSGGMAPKAEIILYSIPSLFDQDIMGGLLQLVYDNTVDVASMSFSEVEQFYTADYNDGEDLTYMLQEYEDLFAQGNAQGITFIASSGDSGALPLVPLNCFNTAGQSCGSFLPGVNYPASSPHVTAVGGTDLVTTYRPGDLDSKYIRESAYADPLATDIFYDTAAVGGYWGSGGGNSTIFSKPAYQQLVNTGSKSARTVPDLALNMGGCPKQAIHCQPDDGNDIEVVGGLRYGVIGTSASAPDFAGLTALLIERLGTRLGNANYYIYNLAAEQHAGALPNKVFHEGIQGFNGLYSTTPTGYNRVLGNGSVDAAGFLRAPDVPLAGYPQTPSNP